MPARAARALTESSRPLDRRILTRSVLGLNSNRTGTIPDKSYSERSAVATKCSASSSVLRTGSLFNFLFLLFIVLDFLSVHIARTDRPNEDGIAAFAKRKHHENMPSASTPPNGLEALLRFRMLRIWVQRHRPSKNLLDFRDRNTMALALIPVAIIPVKPGRGKVHDVVYDCTYKCQSYSARLARPQDFSDDHRPRSSRKRSIGAAELMALMRDRRTPVHWKPHFSSTRREAGLLTRAPDISVSCSRSPKAWSISARTASVAKPRPQ